MDNGQEKDKHLNQVIVDQMNILIKTLKKQVIFLIMN